jgi:hypothetical protein
LQLCRSARVTFSAEAQTRQIQLSLISRPIRRSPELLGTRYFGSALGRPPRTNHKRPLEPPGGSAASTAIALKPR